MSSVFTKFLVLPLAVVAQVFSTIPETAIRLTLFYPSSSRDAAAKFSAPTAMTVALSGNIYVVDDGNSRIVKLGRTGRFILEFGGSGSEQAAIQRSGLGASITVDQNENVYVGNSVSPKVQVFDSNGGFIRSFRVPFPVMSIAVNRKQEIHVAVSTNSATAKLILVFSETGTFLRQFGDRLVTNPGQVTRSVNQAVIACDREDNLYLAFRSWPIIRKYSPAGILTAEQQFPVPSELVSEAERKNFSLDFIARNADSSFVLPLLTHSISISGSGRGYLLLNAHSVVIFDSNCRVRRQFRFRAPRDRENLFTRLVGNLNSRRLYLLDTRSGEIYVAPEL